MSVIPCTPPEFQAPPMTCIFATFFVPHARAGINDGLFPYLLKPPLTKKCSDEIRDLPRKKLGLNSPTHYLLCHPLLDRLHLVHHVLSLEPGHARHESYGLWNIQLIREMWRKNQNAVVANVIAGVADDKRFGLSALDGAGAEKGVAEKDDRTDLAHDGGPDRFGCVVDDLGAL